MLKSIWERIYVEGFLEIQLNTMLNVGDKMKQINRKLQNNQRKDAINRSLLKLIIFGSCVGFINLKNADIK